MAGRRFVQGVLVGLAIAVPIWAALGMVGVAWLRPGPTLGTQAAVLILASILEAGLLYSVWRAFGSLSRAPLGAVPAAWSVLRPYRQTALLTVMAGAFLNYHYWDVQLQIAALPHVTMFVPVPKPAVRTADPGAQPLNA